MNAQKIENAMNEAYRFLAAADQWKKAEEEKRDGWYSLPKQSGAVKRASMDLTRALAELRKPY
jgi:hypothetical protein